MLLTYPSAHHLQPHAAPRDPVPPSEGDRPDGQREAGADNAPAGQGGWGHRGAESQRPDEVGGPDAHLQGPSRGNSEGGADLQLPLTSGQEEQKHSLNEAESLKASSALFFAPDGGDSRQEKPLPIPFVEGYAALKAQHYDAVVGVEVGEYVIFLGEDAQEAAKAMGTNILSVDIPGIGITDMTGSNLGWPSVLRRLMEQHLSIVLAQQDPEGGPEAPYEIIKERYAEEYDLRTDEEYAQEALVTGGTSFEMNGRSFQVSRLNMELNQQIRGGIMMKESSKTQIVGRITYAYDTPEEFTDAEEYLQTIRDELPYMATTGMRFETLTKDPEVRKAVDDIVYDFNGEKNPHPLAYYQADGQKTPVKEGKAKER